MSVKQLGLFTGENIFCDWEFLDDGCTIDPISIGLVSDRGEYYAVNKHADMMRIEGHPFLSKHVLPNLPLAKGSVYADGSGKYLDLRHPAVKSLPTIRDEVLEFVLQHESPNLWGWYSSYDFVTLAQLFGPMVDLPPGFPTRMNDLKTICEYLGNPRVPEQTGVKHVSLFDAQYQREIFNFLCDIERGVIPDWEWFKEPVNHP